MNRKSKRTALLSFVFSLLFTCATAQVNILSTQLVCKNDTATWTMQFMVEEGFYVFAPDYSDNDGTSMPMEITWSNIPHSLQPVGKIQWPDPNFHNNKSVFTTGEYTVQQKFILPVHSKKTTVVMKGKLLFQGCREDQCFPPNELAFETKL